jgi:hypothetical protein
MPIVNALAGIMVSDLTTAAAWPSDIPVSVAKAPLPRELAAEESVMVHEFIAVNREEIIRRRKVKVATRSVAPPPTRRSIDHGWVFHPDHIRKLLHPSTMLGDLN